MKTHKVVFDPNQNPSFCGAFFNGTEIDCIDYCNANNGKTGNFFTLVTILK